MGIQSSKFVRKPLLVDAIQVTEENIQLVAEWCHGEVSTVMKDGGEAKYVKVRVHNPLRERQTQAFPGDWVLYAGTGYRVYTRKAFQDTFEVAPA